MPKEVREVCYDETLRIEACRFAGLAQTFPTHFHEYEVLGCMEAGRRWLFCNNKEYPIGAGDLLLFAPHDTHGCTPCGMEPLSYRALHVSREIMQLLIKDHTGEEALPAFSNPVLRDPEMRTLFLSLHEGIMARRAEMEKEEALLQIVSLILTQCGQTEPARLPSCGEEIRRACAWMQAHYADHITLADLCRCSGLGRSTLLRAFTKEKGVTPYRYLQALRIEKARELLEQGAVPVQAALATGFSDQSHLTNTFRTLTGLSPAAYRRIFWSAQDKELLCISRP